MGIQRTNEPVRIRGEQEVFPRQQQLALRRKAHDLRADDGRAAAQRHHIFDDGLALPMHRYKRRNLDDRVVLGVRKVALIGRSTTVASAHDELCERTNSKTPSRVPCVQRTRCPQKGSETWPCHRAAPRRDGSPGGCRKRQPRAARQAPHIRLDAYTLASASSNAPDMSTRAALCAATRRQAAPPNCRPSPAACHVFADTRASDACQHRQKAAPHAHLAVHHDAQDEEHVALECWQHERPARHSWD